MAAWTLADIREKIRQITGRLSTSDFSNFELDDRINKYYQFTFPAEVKLEKKHTYYEFETSPYTHLYPLPNVADNASNPTVAAYTNFEPPATIDGLQLLWYQNPGVFFQQNPQDQVQRNNSNTGDGVTTSFSITTSPTTILPGSTVVTDNVELYQDSNEIYADGNINLVSNDAGNGTVNYTTGVINVNFSVPPANGQVIYFSWSPFIPGRPTAVLLYNNNFQFYPVPDTAYRFKVQAYSVVSPLVAATDTPELSQWGPAIAYGTARQIHADFGEMDAYQELTVLYKEQIDYVLRRTHQTLLTTRALPFF